MRKNAQTFAISAVLLTATISGCAVLEGFLEGGVSGAVGAAAEVIAKSAIESLENGEVAQEYTADQQYYIGRGVSAAVLTRYEPILDDSDQHRAQIVYMNEMGGYIREASLNVTRNEEDLGDHISRDDEAKQRIEHLYLFKGLHVGILNTDEVAAFATPGGFIWVSRGSINMCRTEDELAAIVCHELGHVVMDHGMDNYREANNDQISDNPLFKNAMGDSTLGATFGDMIGGVADDLIDSGYSKDQEFEADNWGTRALAEAGYDPHAMVRMLKQVEAYEKSHGGKGGGYLDNHPAAKDRIEQVEDLIKDAKLKPARATMSQEAIRDRQVRFEKTFK
jgi:hypothetical protein